MFRENIFWLCVEIVVNYHEINFCLLIISSPIWYTSFTISRISRQFVIVVFFLEDFIVLSNSNSKSSK